MAGLDLNRSLSSLSAQAEIAAVIGQTELLFRHKFFFYEQMITKHESGASGGRGALEGRLVTAEDLLGYWELMHLEIDNLDARYVRLTEWQAAGWAGALSDLQGGTCLAAGVGSWLVSSQDSCTRICELFIEHGFRSE